jgi:hypothetical protein
VELRPEVILDGLLALPGARQVRVLQEPEAVRVFLVAGAEPATGLARAAEAWFRRVARERGFSLPPLFVEVVPHLGGSEATMGKFRPVECRLPPQR